MKNERPIVPCCGDPDGDSPEARLVWGKPTAKDYLAVAGIVIKASFGLAKEFIKDPKGFIDVWSDEFADETDRFIGCP